MVHIKVFSLILGLFLLSQSLFSMEDPGVGGTRTIPYTLLRPDRGEAPRFPRDIVIGDLGRGDAPGNAYLLARNSLSALTRGLRDDPIPGNDNYVIANRHFEEVSGIRTRSFRLGGGRIEQDGSVSFLVRFIGPEETITGEMFLRQREELDDPDERIWLLDDLFLEERRPLLEIGDSYRFDFSPYERFF